MKLAFQIDDKNIKYINMLIPLAAIAIALLIGAILIAMAGFNPWQAYSYMLYGSFGNLYGFGETLTRFIPMLFVGLGFSVAFKTGFFNIGGEGQLYMGALGALIVGVYIQGLPAFVHILLALLAGCAFGAFWCYIAGFLKMKTGANELINTMMLNYIVWLLIDLLLKGVLKDPASMIDQSERIAVTAQLPYILPGTRLHLGIIIGLLAAFVVYYLIWRTPIGYQIRTIGSNPNVASYSGMNIVGTTSIAVLISGGLAGLGGAIEILGNQHRLMHGFSPGYGFDGIAAAFMGRNNPWGIVLATLLFAGLRVGAGAMQRGMGIPLPLIYVIQGLVIILVMVSAYFTTKLSTRMIGGRA